MTSQFCFCLLLSLFICVNSDKKMMVVWGQPESTTNAIVNKFVDWDECLQICYESATCVMAWKGNDSCLMYNFDKMGSVLQTSSLNKSIVAFKGMSPENECPIGFNPPTFNNQNATGLLYINNYPPNFPYYVNYTIYSNNGKWDLTYSYKYSCQGTYNHIIEYSNSSGLCVHSIYAGNDGSFAYDRSLELCEGNNNYLAGLVEKTDFQWFESRGQELRKLTTSKDVYARIDGVRTKKCQSTPKTTECMSPKGFKFTGPAVPNFNNYKWMTNSSAQATKDDNCLVMVFKGSGTVRIDVRGCSYDTALKSQMTFCSRPAWSFGVTDYFV